MAEGGPPWKVDQTFCHRQDVYIITSCTFLSSMEIADEGGYLHFGISASWMKGLLHPTLSGRKIDK